MAVTIVQIRPTKSPWVHTTTDSKVGVSVGVLVGTSVAVKVGLGTRVNVNVGGTITCSGIVGVDVSGMLVAVGKTIPPIPLPDAVVGVLLGLIGAGVSVADWVAACVAAWVAVLAVGTTGVGTLTFWNVAVGVAVAITIGVPAKVGVNVAM